MKMMTSCAILIVSLAVLALLVAWLIVRSIVKKYKSSRILVFDLGVIEVMVLYLIGRIIIFEQGFNSAPSSVVLLETVYFLVPLGVVNLVYVIFKKRLHK